LAGAGGALGQKGREEWQKRRTARGKQRGPELNTTKRIGNSWRGKKEGVHNKKGMTKNQPNERGGVKNAEAEEKKKKTNKNRKKHGVLDQEGMRIRTPG